MLTLLILISIVKIKISFQQFSLSEKIKKIYGFFLLLKKYGFFTIKKYINKYYKMEAQNISLIKSLLDKFLAR